MTAKKAAAKKTETKQDDVVVDETKTNDDEVQHADELANDSSNDTVQADVPDGETLDNSSVPDEDEEVELSDEYKEEEDAEQGRRRAAREESENARQRYLDNRPEYLDTHV